MFLWSAPWMNGSVNKREASDLKCHRAHYYVIVIIWCYLLTMMLHIEAEWCTHTSKTNHHWFRSWLLSWSITSHYLNQYWIIVDLNLGNKLQRNLKWNSFIFIQVNAFKNIVCKMAPAILSWIQCVNYTYKKTSHLSYIHYQAYWCLGGNMSQGISWNVINLSALLQLHLHSPLNTWLQYITQRQL